MVSQTTCRLIDLPRDPSARKSHLAGTAAPKILKKCTGNGQTPETYVWFCGRVQFLNYWQSFFQQNYMCF